MAIRDKLIAAFEQLFPPQSYRTDQKFPEVLSPLGMGAGGGKSSPEVQQQPDRQRLMDAYAKGFEHFGNPPAATLSGLMVDESQKYPIFQKYPFLPAALTILESGGGSNMGPRQLPHNITSWGINLPPGYFEPQSVEEVLLKTLSGIGKRTSAYEPFRQSGNLEDLGNIYAPDSDNPGTGGANYANNARKIMDIFQAAYGQ